MKKTITKHWLPYRTHLREEKKLKPFSSCPRKLCQNPSHFHPSGCWGVGAGWGGRGRRRGADERGGAQFEALSSLNWRYRRRAPSSHKGTLWSEAASEAPRVLPASQVLSSGRVCLYNPSLTCRKHDPCTEPPASTPTCWKHQKEIPFQSKWLKPRLPWNIWILRWIK